MNSRELAELQLEQEQHDQLAHGDILSLPVERRITHMALHFAKYTGRLIEMQGVDRQGLERIIVDTTIICLCSANALRLRLGEIFESASDLPRPPFSPAALPMWLGSQLAVQNAGIAKACEAFDHREEFPYEDVLTAGVIGILRASLATADALSIDLATAIRCRWEGIEKRLRRRAAA